MDWVVIHGVSPYDGRYPFEVADQDGELNITTREWGWIKRLAGVHPVSFEDAVRNMDAELMTAIAVIALRRAGKIDQQAVPAVFETLADAPFGSRILYDSDEPAEVAAEPDPPMSSSSLRPGSSGDESTPTLVTSPDHPNGSGSHGSGSSGWPQTRSAR